MGRQSVNHTDELHYSAEVPLTQIDIDFIFEERWNLGFAYYKWQHNCPLLLLFAH